MGLGPRGMTTGFSSSGDLPKGDLDGPFKAFYGGGQRLSEGAYLDGVEDGSWKFYLEDGFNTFTGRTANCSRPFASTVRSPNGAARAPASEYTYKDKQLKASSAVARPGGFVLESSRSSTRRNAAMTRDAGRPNFKEGEYVQGELDGPVYHYDLVGRLLKTEHYNMARPAPTLAGEALAVGQYPYFVFQLAQPSRVACSLGLLPGS